VLTAVVCLWSMIYTGSRTGMVMLPVGFVMFAAITLNRKVLIAVGCFILLGAVMVLRPNSSRALFVMSTAFSAADDPSMLVRIRNQELVRSYIRANPIGFGLGSTGELGLKYAPHTFIGSFPPDSEYVEIAIESGYVGLFIWCVILGILFGYGVSVYFKIKDREWKMVMVIVLVIFFMMMVAQYPQEFFRSQVLTVLFSSMLALMAKIDYKCGVRPSNPNTDYE
jgi:putative inorganic carbon (hco3(-)) transporter